MATPRTGTYTIDDLLAVQNQTVQEFDEEKVAEVVRTELNAHNRRYQDMAQTVMRVTTERILTFGVGDQTDMLELDEFSRTPTQKLRDEVGTFNLPLRKYGDAIGWTRDYLLQVTPAELARRILDMQWSDVKLLYRLIRRALFVPTNYSVRDFLIDNATMNVVRLLNADSMPIPPGPEGQTFNAATHTHYLGSATWTEAAIDGAIAHIREHGHLGTIRIHINATNRSNIAALSKFTPLQAPLLQYGANLTVARGTLDNAQDDNRGVGVWDGLYEVWTKPWVPANYVFVYDVNGPKPLAMRVPEPATLRGLRLVNEIDLYPLRAEYYEHRVGVGVENRSNGAIVQMNNASYTAPAGI